MALMVGLSFLIINKNPRTMKYVTTMIASLRVALVSHALLSSTRLLRSSSAATRDASSVNWSCSFMLVDYSPKGFELMKRIGKFRTKQKPSMFGQLCICELCVVHV